MHRNHWFRTGLAVSLGMSLSLAGGIAFAQGSLTALPAAKGIVIDGHLDDWDMAAFGGRPTFVVSPKDSVIDPGTVGSDEENSGRIYLAYDDTYLYLAGIITDNNVTGELTAGEIWQNSGIQLWVNAGSPEKPERPVVYGEYEDADFQITLTPLSEGRLLPTYWVFPASKYEALNGNGSVEVAAAVWFDAKRDGYTIEARLPRAKFPGLSQLGKGSTLRLAVSLIYNNPKGDYVVQWVPGVQYAEVRFQ